MGLLPGKASLHRLLRIGGLKLASAGFTPPSIGGRSRLLVPQVLYGWRLAVPKCDADNPDLDGLTDRTLRWLHNAAPR